MQLINKDISRDGDADTQHINRSEDASVCALYESVIGICNVSLML